MLRLKSLPLVALAMLGSATLAGAADLGPAVAPVADESPVEFGAGWYIRGDLAWTQDKVPVVYSDLVTTFSDKKRFGASGAIGAGYQLNNFFRLDATLEVRRNQTQTITGPNVVCPYQLVGYNSAVTNSPLGFAYNTNDTCAPTESSRVGMWGGLVNAYLDLGAWRGVTPYVGAGVGFFAHRTSANLNYYRTSDGAPYAADLTATGTFPLIWVDALNGARLNPQPNVSFTRQNWNRQTFRTTYKLGWALMGGVAIDITRNMKLDVGYRYLSLGDYTSLPNRAGNTTTKRLSAQEVRLGVRYLID